MSYYHAPYDFLFVLPLLLMIAYAIVRERRSRISNRKAEFNVKSHKRDRRGRFCSRDFRDWDFDGKGD